MAIPVIFNGVPQYPPAWGVVILPPMWRTSEFKLAFGPVTDWVFTGKEFTLTVRGFDESTSQQFTEADFELSVGDTVATITKSAEWVAENLPAQWYECHFAVNGVADHWAVMAFQLIQPIGGSITR